MAAAAGALPVCVGAQSPEAAQTSQTVQIVPSPALRCLVPAPALLGGPEYPFVPFKERHGGRVRVELRFAGPDSEPDVKVLESSATGPKTSARASEQAFEEAVRNHLRQLRVPCMTPTEAPAVLEQEYEFKPDSRVALWSRPIDADTLRQTRLLACMRYPSERFNRDHLETARRRQVQGRVVATLVFSAPDQAPGVKLHHSELAEPLLEALEEYVRQLRLPCHEGAPVHAMLTFTARHGALAPYGFKQISFGHYLAQVKGLRQRGLVLDTRAMDCPFDVILQYLQPALPNRVGQVGAHNPTRGPLLEWLATAELDVPAKTHHAIFGDETTFTVPCVNINIQPNRPI